MNEETIVTGAIREAVSMAKAVQAARRTGPIGRIIGKPGTGKTEAGKYIATLAGVFPGAVRLCGVEGESIGRLAKRLYLGLTGERARGSVGDILFDLEELAIGKLLVMDQADKLGWRQLEWLRYLADEAGLGVILIGTELLERKFKDGRSAVYLEQMLSRIGTKTVRFHAYEEGQIEDFTAHCIVPRFGPVDLKTAKAFRAKSHGYWRDAADLADACQALMEAQGVTRLTLAIVEHASAYMAPARAAA